MSNAKKTACLAMGQGEVASHPMFPTQRFAAHEQIPHRCVSCTHGFELDAVNLMQ
jgi:hypothetical protein